MGKQALWAAALALLAGGCGAGHKTAPPPSRATFLAEANQICAAASTHTERLDPLRALRAPAGASDLFAHWLTAEKDAVAAAKSLADGTKKTRLEPAVALAIAEGKIAGYARRLGAKTSAKRTVGTMPP